MSNNMPLNFLIAFTMLQIVCVNTQSGRIMPLEPTLRFKEDISKSSVENHNKAVVCAVDSWAHSRPGEGKFQISDIDPTLCTQLIYRGATLDASTFQIKMRDESYDPGAYQEIVKLKVKSPKLKVLLSVGGWGQEVSATFTKIAEDHRKREKFVDSVVQHLNKYKFDGLDVDWQYPGVSWAGGRADDKTNLPFLLRDLRNKFQNNFLLTLTVSGDRHAAKDAYDLKSILEPVDHFNLRTFDYAGFWSDITNHHAAITDDTGKLSIEDTLGFYMNENGVPPEKIVLGIPFFGRTFRLESEPRSSSDNETKNATRDDSGFNQKSLKNHAWKGKWGIDDSLGGYNEICHNLTKHSGIWKTYTDHYCGVPFARNGIYWISYDDLESVTSKVVEAFHKKLKGVLAYTIDTDDFKGTACALDDQPDADDETLVKFPMLRTINYAFHTEVLRQGGGGDVTVTPDSPFRSDTPDMVSDSNKNSGSSFMSTYCFCCILVFKVFAIS